MNKKVSMVMTCYNKANYIGAMLESVLSQTWDNIELILVNDGSTDGSRNVIASYEKRLRERFDLLIIDQENQGRASGLRNGFLRVTGDYVCTPDCDDRLEPDYVLTLAAYLEKNRDVKWVCGDMDCWPLDFSSDTYLYGGEHGFLNRLDNDTWLDAMLSKRVSVTPVTLLARRDCFDKCNFIDNFLTGREYCQEQQIRIPLLANGKGAHINKVLYKYTILAVGSMTEWWRKSADTYYGFLENYRIDAINALKLNNAYSDRRRALFDIGAVKMIANNGIDYDRGKAVESLLENAASAGIFPVSAIRRKTALEAGFAVLHHHLCNHIIRLNGRVKDLRPTGKGRVIAYAAYGMA
ncbi:MAG: glycosyltransferase family 2 protein, partial [Clostridiales bacterium]|nr:glycosyltransferase family 2 protein [Clostridiales bacterium]